MNSTSLTQQMNNTTPKPAAKKLAVAPKPIAISKPALSPSEQPLRSSPPQYATNQPPVQKLSTSKVWVLPPRPKPGRKPSTDTPPTKRKAQNRAAQRAFRERRAQRVNELEQMLEEVNDERDVREQKMNDTLKAMSQENFELRNSLEELRKEIRAFTAGSRAPQSPYEATTPTGQQSYSPGSMNGLASNNGSISGPSSYPPMNQMASPAPSLESPMDVLDRVLDMRLPVPESSKESPSPKQVKDDDDCGICIKESCICESLGIREKREPQSNNVDVVVSSNSSLNMQNSISLSSSTSGSVQLKRPRKSGGVKNLNPFKKLKSSPEQMEVDFTKVFAKEQENKLKKEVIREPSPPPISQTMSAGNTPVDPCGFCSDGTPCLCAEAAEQEASNMADINTLPPLASVNSSSSRKNSALNLLRLPALQLNNGSASEESKGGCTGTPGTCPQCQSDPMSTLFCTTLANQVDKTKKQSGGCCGGSKSGGGCCKDKQQESAGTFIPCSAAYQTLSRHNNFTRIDLGTLVGKLTTKGMQVEVSSVANVLRELDKRLYQ